MDRRWRRPVVVRLSLVPAAIDAHDAPDTYQFEGRGGQRVVFDLTSSAFDLPDGDRAVLR